ncbi:Malate dehydrogenase [Alphaproteobacteria bacterium]
MKEKIVAKCNKIALIGGGNIGGALAYMMRYKNLGDVVLLDRTAETAQGKALDINESTGIELQSGCLFGTAEYSDIEGADLVIITAGVARKPGMSRDDLLNTNAEIIKCVAEKVRKYASDAFVIVVTNPLDAMVHVFQSYSGLHRHKVVGMAGVLDSGRFCYFLAKALNISARDISTITLGGHGNGMVPLPRFTSVGGIPLSQIIEMGMLSKEKLEAVIERTKNGGGEIVALLQTCSAYYAPATSVIAMAESYLFDQKRMLSCATYLNGEYGVNNLYVGVPVIIGANGAERVVEIPLNEQEYAMFHESVAGVRALTSMLKF